MMHTSHIHHHHRARRALRVEGLEGRALLTSLAGSVTDPAAPVLVSALDSSSTATEPAPIVNQTAPASGVDLTQSPSELSITFAQPIDPFSMIVASLDFELDQVAADGTASPIDATILSEPSDLFDPTSTLVLTLSQPLGVGHYRLILPASSGLTWYDSELPVSPGVDQVLTDFTIAPPGVKLSDATPLGTVGATATVVPGNLDFQNQPTAVALYQVTLPAGHFWQFGAEVSSWSEGGNLSSDLTLFDASGRVLVTSRTGRPDRALDPYLFSGLTPGTYYVGVSDAFNIPGQSGGYDPATGTPGATSPTQAGGTFTLHLIAHSEDAPPRLLGSALSWGDPLDAAPTGLTLAFSAPLDPSGLRGDQATGLFLQDQNGRTWPLTAVGDNEAQGLYTFLFDNHLPAGTYTLSLPQQGGLTDLAGLHPVAKGQPVGVLLSFTVPPTATTSGPQNLGALLPSVTAGISRSETLTPGGGVTYRFVVTVPGTYKIQNQYTGGSLAALLIGPRGVVSLAQARQADGLFSTSLELARGVYYLQWINPGTTAVAESWTLRANLSFDSLLNTGALPGPALNLTLVAPGDPGLTTAAPVLNPPSGPVTVGFTPGSPTASGPVVAGASSSSSSPGAGAESIALGSPASASGLVLTLGNTPVGLPSASAEYVAAVGPGVETGTTALSLAAAGLPPGINFGSGFARQAARTDPREPEPAHAADSETSPVTTAADAAPSDGALTLAALTVEPGPEAATLAESEWLGRIIHVVGDWFTPTDPSTGGTEAVTVAQAGMEAGLGGEPSPLNPDQPAPRLDSGQTERAALGTPLSLIVLSAVALRMRRPARDWIKKRQLDAASHAGQRAGFRGPHTPRWSGNPSPSQPAAR